MADSFERRPLIEAISPRWRKALAIALPIIAIASLYLIARFSRDEPVTYADPEQHFKYGSTGGERESGIPYWIWKVLPKMFPEYLPGNKDGYASIGVYWIAGEELPVGFSKKTLGVIPRVAPNCAFCHQGSYRLHPDDPAFTLFPRQAYSFLQGFFAPSTDQDRRALRN